MQEFIKLLRERANLQRRYAFGALIMSVVVIGFGGWYFIYQSPKIAVQDIEEKMKIAPSSEIISDLAKLQIAIDDLQEDLGKAKIELDEIEKTIHREGNYDLKANLIPSYTFFYDYSKTIDITEFNPDLNSGLYKEDIYIHNYKLKTVDELLTRLQLVNEFLVSEEAKVDYFNKLKEKRISLEKSLASAKSRSNTLDSELKGMLHRIEEIGESSLSSNLKRQIHENGKNIKEITYQIDDIDSKLNFDSYTEKVSKQLDKMFNANKNIFDSLSTYKVEMVKNLEFNENKLSRQKDIVEKLRSEIELKKAERTYISENLANSRPSEERNEIAFYVSTNIVRFGVVLITIFLAQVFISIYRYLTKISNFYDARADALHLLMQEQSFHNHDLSNLFEKLSINFSPDQVDFGQMPQPPINESLNAAQSFIKKT